MQFRHLRSFVVLADERHFGRAAARLHIAQPALSQQLKALETDVGVRLLDRSSRRVELTEAGRLLQQRAEGLLADADRTVADLALLAEGRAGRVRIGFVGTATYDLLPRVAREVRDRLPDLDLEVHGELLGPQLIDRLRSGGLDLAVLRPGTSRIDDLRVTRLREEPLVAVLPSGHRLVDAPTVDLRELAGDVLVTHPSGHRSTMQPLVLDALRSVGVDPEVLEVGETGTLVAYVAAGLGVGLVPASVRALRVDGVTYRELSTQVLATLAVATRQGPDEKLRRVLDIVSRQAAMHGQQW